MPRFETEEERQAWHDQLNKKADFYGRQAEGYRDLGNQMRAGIEKNNADNKSAVDREKLKRQEEGGGTATSTRQGAPKSTQQETDAKFKDITDNYGKTAQHPLGKGEKGKKNSKFAKFLKKHKGWFIGGGLLGAGLFPLILLLLFILGTLSIQNFTKDLIGFEFARAVRQNIRSTNNVVGEDANLETAPSKASYLGTKYNNLKQKTMRRFYGIGVVQDISAFRNKYSFNKVSENLGRQVRYNYEYSNTFIGGRRIASISIPKSGGLTTIELPKKSFNPFRNFSGNIALSKQLGSALDEALDLQNVSSLARSAAFIRVMRSMGASWAGLIASRFKNKTPTDANAELAKEAYDVVHDPTVPEGLSSSDAKAAAEDVSNAQDEAMSSVETIKGPGGLPNIARTGAAPNDFGLPTRALIALSNAYTGSKLQTIAKTIAKYTNPIYNVAVPVCMVIDGSTYSPNLTNSKDAAAAREGAQLIATGAAQRAGSPNIDPAELGAVTRKMGGNVPQSNLMREISNQPVNTLATPTPQQTPFGTFNSVSIFDYVFQDLPTAAHVLDSVSGFVCPKVTNIYFGLGVGIAALAGKVVAAFFTGGTATAGESLAEGAVEDAASTAVTSIGSRLAAQFLTRQGLSETYNFAKQLGWDVVKQGGLIAGATFLAKWIVASYGSSITGTATGQPYLDQTQQGVNYLVNADMQSNGGAAMPNIAVAQSDQEDTQFRLLYNQSQSFSTRYFALSNPDSLLSRVGMNIASVANRNFFANTLASLGRLLKPTTIIPRLIGSISGSVSAANTSKYDLKHYGNVQFGWTKAEEDLVDTHESYYNPLDNQLFLENSGKQDEIVSTYEKCFTEPVGTLLGDGDIKRDDYGNVINDQGLCSPQNLGPNNPKYGDLVFRYRLSLDFDNTMRIQLGIQNAGG